MKTTMNFDIIIDRRYSSAIKWEKYKGTDIIPMWVADMDFPSSPSILKALHERIDHGIFGYTQASDELYELIISNLKTKYSWNIKKEWIVWLPGLVPGINVACRTVGNEGDDVITHTPIYPPFLDAPSLAKRTLTKVPMVLHNDRWSIDYDRFIKAIKPNTKLFLLCSPQNPTGRVFDYTELERLSNICRDHNLILCSDEIHCDLLLDENKLHIPTASINKTIEQNSITLMSPSKTYNIAGLGFSYAIIPNDLLRKGFQNVCNGILPYVNILGYTAAIAAYKYSDDWLHDVLHYLRINRNILEEHIDAMSGLSMTRIEATYLAWINVKALDLEDPVSYFEQAGVGLLGGKVFGDKDYVRLNFGCPRSVLEKALKRIKKTLS